MARTNHDDDEGEQVRRAILNARIAGPEAEELWAIAVRDALTVRDFNGAVHWLKRVSEENKNWWKFLAKAINEFKTEDNIVALLARAAEAGSADAAENMAKRHREGNGVEKADAEAAKYYAIAGKSYETGSGAMQDFRKARDMFALAVGCGDASAQPDVERVERKIRKNDRFNTALSPFVSVPTMLFANRTAGGIAVVLALAAIIVRLSTQKKEKPGGGELAVFSIAVSVVGWFVGVWNWLFG